MTSEIVNGLGKPQEEMCDKYCKLFFECIFYLDFQDDI